MKSSALTAFLLLVNSVLFASDRPDLKFLDCRKYIAEAGLSLTTSQLVFNDLTNGVWTATNELAQKKVFQFNESGSAYIFSVEPGSPASFKTNLWHIEEFGGIAFLALTDEDNDRPTFFSVVQTCDGIILSETLTHRELMLSYSPLATNGEIKLLKSKLTGDWTSISYPFDLEAYLSKEELRGAFLTYNFQPDGTYLRVCGNDTKRVEERGVWQISKDGQYLIFHVAAKGPTENILGTKVASIKQVDDHLLEIELLTPQFDPIVNLCTELKAFAFIK